MAYFEKDHHEVKMVSETCNQVKDSKFQRIISRKKQKVSSISIPIYEENSSLDSDAYATQAPVTEKGNMDDGKHEHLLRSGELGMCSNVSYCTCPTDSKLSQLTPSDAKLHNNTSEDDKNLGRELSSRVMNLYSKFVQHGERICAIISLVETFIDPLFFFLIYVKKDDICVDINWRIAISLVVYRSIGDFLYFFYIIRKFKRAYSALKSKELDNTKKNAIKYLKGYCLVDFFIIFPFPQILIIILPRYLRSAGANYGQFLGVGICVQYLFRLICVCSTTGFEHAKDFRNLLIFFLFGHLVGSCWYLFGLQRVNECLQNVCNSSNIAECSTFIGCSNSHKKLDLWINNGNAIACLNSNSSTDFSYGMYEDAVPLTLEKYFFHKYLFALFWGFQQVMSLGDNLKPTHDIVLEVCFAMAIIGLGLWFFVRLINHIPNILELLQTLRQRIIPKAGENHWAAAKPVNEEMLLKKHKKKNDGEEATKAEMFIETSKGIPREKEIDEEFQFVMETLQDSIKQSMLKRKEEISILKKQHENDLKVWIMKVERFEEFLKCFLKQNNPHLNDESLDVMMENFVTLKESNGTTNHLSIENVREEKNIGQEIEDIDQEQNASRDRILRKRIN